MKGDVRKLFAFLTSKSSDNHRKPRSVTIACGREVMRQETDFILHDGDSGLYKQTHNTLRRRRKSQPVIRNRELFASKAPSGYRCNFGPVYREYSVALERRRVANDFNLDKSVMMNDFDKEDTRIVWNSMKDKSIFSETSIQDGYLTTILCSTEL